MSTYAIGDLQGCYVALKALLAEIDFQPNRDRLWFTGDLVNRGPDSLQTLRWVKQHEDSCVTVLGNHDLHLLAVAEGFVRHKAADTLQDILWAPDRGKLIHWLRTRPMVHVEGDTLLVHAGLLPQWSRAKAVELAKEVEAVLGGDGYRDFLACLYGNQPDHWRDDHAGFDRLRAIVNAMTRLRYCNAEGRMDFKYKGPVTASPPGYQPWFEAPQRQWQGGLVVFGHWSALGYRRGPDYLALDSGCLWGGALTAVRLEDGRRYQVDCAGLAGTRPIE